MWNVAAKTGGAHRQVQFMKLQLNTVKKDYISSRYIPFNINRKPILLSLILMPKPHFKVHFCKTAVHAGPGISCLPIHRQKEYTTDTSSA